MSHWMSQLRAKMLVQQNVGTVGKQVKKTFEFWGKVAMETLWPNNLSVGSVSPENVCGSGGNHRRFSI